MKKYFLENSIQYKNEEGEIIAEIDFPKTGENEITITHTFVSPVLRGQGIAKELIEQVILYAKENNLKIKATCSYAVSYFEKNQSNLYIK